MKTSIVRLAALWLIVASTSRADVPRDVGPCDDQLTAARLTSAVEHVPQLRSWLGARARTVFEGGVEVNAATLALLKHLPDPAREDEVRRLFAALARGARTDFAPWRAQIVIREDRPGPVTAPLILVEDLSWDPERGRPASGEFILVLPAKTVAPRGRGTQSARSAAHRFVRLPPRDDVADRLIEALRRLRRAGPHLRAKS